MADDALIPWTGLDDVEKAIDTLAERARKLREPSRARGRELLQVLVQEVTIPTRDYTPREVTYYNGDRRDLVVNRLTCCVYRANTLLQRTVMTRLGGGYLPSYAGAAEYPITGWGILAGASFDFVWNYRRDVTQSFYGRAQDRMASLSSFSLGDVMSKRMLEFRRPLVLRKGEGAVFSVTPKLFLNTTTGDNYIVAFLGFGFRREPEG